MDWSSTAQANAFSLIYGPSNFDQSSPSVPYFSGPRDKAHGGDGQPNFQNWGCFKPRRTRGAHPCIRPSVPGAHNWFHSWMLGSQVPIWGTVLVQTRRSFIVSLIRRLVGRYAS